MSDNDTGHESNRLLGLQGCLPKASGEEMVSQVNKKPTINSETSRLLKQDIYLLLVTCAELVNLCTKFTRKIDPAAAAMLAYVRDEIVAKNKDEPH